MTSINNGSQGNLDFQGWKTKDTMLGIAFGVAVKVEKDPNHSDRLVVLTRNLFQRFENFFWGSSTEDKFCSRTVVTIPQSIPALLSADQSSLVAFMYDSIIQQRGWTTSDYIQSCARQIFEALGSVKATPKPLSPERVVPLTEVSSVVSARSDDENRGSDLAPVSGDLASAPFVHQVVRQVLSTPPTSPQTSQGAVAKKTPKDPVFYSKPYIAELNRNILDNLDAILQGIRSGRIVLGKSPHSIGEKAPRLALSFTEKEPLEKDGQKIYVEPQLLATLIKDLSERGQIELVHSLFEAFKGARVMRQREPRSLKELLPLSLGDIPRKSLQGKARLKRSGDNRQTLKIVVDTLRGARDLSGRMNALLQLKGFSDLKDLTFGKFCESDHESGIVIRQLVVAAQRKIKKKREQLVIEKERVEEFSSRYLDFDPRSILVEIDSQLSNLSSLANQHTTKGWFSSTVTPLEDLTLTELVEYFKGIEKAFKKVAAIVKTAPYGIRNIKSLESRIVELIDLVEVEELYLKYCGHFALAHSLKKVGEGCELELAEAKDMKSDGLWAASTSISDYQKILGGIAERLAAKLEATKAQEERADFLKQLKAVPADSQEAEEIKQAFVREVQDDLTKRQIAITRSVDLFKEKTYDSLLYGNRQLQTSSADPFEKYVDQALLLSSYAESWKAYVEQNKEAIEALLGDQFQVSEGVFSKTLVDKKFEYLTPSQLLSFRTQGETAIKKIESQHQAFEVAYRKFRTAKKEFQEAYGKVRFQTQAIKRKIEHESGSNGFQLVYLNKLFQLSIESKGFLKLLNKAVITSPVQMEAHVSGLGALTSKLIGTLAKIEEDGDMTVLDQLKAIEEDSSFADFLSTLVTSLRNGFIAKQRQKIDDAVLALEIQLKSFPKDSLIHRRIDFLKELKGRSIQDNETVKIVSEMKASELKEWESQISHQIEIANLER